VSLCLCINQLRRARTIQHRTVSYTPRPVHCRSRYRQKWKDAASVGCCCCCCCCCLASVAKYLRPPWRAMWFRSGHQLRSFPARSIFSRAESERWEAASVYNMRYRWRGVVVVVLVATRCYRWANTAAQLVATARWRTVSWSIAVQLSVGQAAADVDTASSSLSVTDLSSEQWWVFLRILPLCKCTD